MNLHMKYTAENAVSSFFYYMWNSWNEEECKLVYGNMSRHFWEKWGQMADKGVFGAAERFYAELSDTYRELLAERAVGLYDGKAFRKQPEDREILVCASCGSRKIEIQAWIDANTDEFHSDVDDGMDSRWCRECENHTGFDTLEDFKRKMESWWVSADLRLKGRITGQKGTDHFPDDGPQAFADTANAWWKSMDYDRKRNIYKEYGH